MAVVCVRGPLRKLAGGRAEHELEGATVVELLRALERRHPEVGGWILDERGLIRRHINVFVNGERGERGDGGAVRGPRRGVTGDNRRLRRLTELVVGTKKGLFLLEGEPGSGLRDQGARVCGAAGRLRDPRSPQRAAVRDRDLAVLRAEDLLHGRRSRRRSGSRPTGVALPEGGDQALERIWVIARGEADGTLYAGGDPGVLFESHDGGASWEINAGLWEQPSRPHWQPGGGGLCLHSICTWPGDPDRLAVAVSAAGMWLTEDGGRTWRRGNDGPQPAVPARGGAARTRTPGAACTTSSARRGNPSGCSCSSTAASTAPTTPAKAGPTSAAAGCRPTSASR